MYPHDLIGIINMKFENYFLRYENNALLWSKINRINMSLLLGIVLAICIEMIVKFVLDLIIKDSIAVVMGSKNFLVMTCMGIKIAVNIFYAIYCVLYLKGRVKNNRLTQILIYSYIALFTVVGTALGIDTYLNSGSTTSFLLSAILVYCFLWVNPIYMMIASAGAFASFLIGVSDSHYIIPGNAASLILFWIIVVAISFINYTEKMFFLKREELQMDMYMEMEQFSVTDILTGLKSYNALKMDAEFFVNDYICVMVADTEDFKHRYNNFDSDEIDRLLIIFTDILVKIFGENNCYRYSEDKFIIIVKESNISKFITLIKRLKNELDESKDFAAVRGSGIPGGYTYGYVEDIADVEDMLRYADIQLFLARDVSRNTIVGNKFERIENDDEDTESIEYYSKSGSGRIDELTGLMSMSYFLTKSKILFHVLEEEQREELAIVYFNVINMKAYNEEFGFDEGDELLKFIANTIKEVFHDKLSTRLSFDHFVVMAKAYDCERGILEVQKRLSRYKNDKLVSIKAGIYIFDKDDTQISRACDHAKLACDKIKRDYNKSFHYYEQSMGELLLKRQYIIDTFENAIKNEDILVYYQPIVNANTLKVCDTEALCRWEDKKYGMLNPGEFIEILETYRLIHKLDLYVVSKICGHYLEFKKHHIEMMPVSINISRLDFELCDIVGELCTLVDRVGLPRNKMHIEITESALSSNNEILRTGIQRLHKAGFEVWMDDFGSGYSSLNILKDYNFDMIKIDMRFLNSLNENPKTRTILAHTIRMIKALNLSALMEGVEMEDHLEFVREVGCNKLQGYYFSKPQSFEVLFEQIKNNILLLEN